jgi:stearoyl-CoA desaturase (delta-9 desaturase)
VLKGQVDMSARIIKVLESLGWARDVRWPVPSRLAARVADPSVRQRIRGWQEPA